MLKQIVTITHGTVKKIYDLINSKRNRATWEKVSSFISNLRHMKIITRLIISFSLLSLIPLLALSIFSYQKYINSINDKLSRSSFQLLDQLDKNMRTEIEKYEHICDQLSIDSLIQESLINFNKFDDSAKGQLRMNINDMFAKKGLFLSYIQNIYIFTSQKEPLFDFGYDSFDNEDIYRFIQGTDQNNPLDFWTFARTRRGIDSLVLCRTINQVTDTSVRIGYIFMVINESEFSNKTYAYVDMGKGSNLFILNDNGLMLSRSNPLNDLGKPFPDHALFTNIQLHQKQGSNAFVIPLEKEKNLILYVYNSRTKWYLVTTIPFSYIRSETSGITAGLILLSIGCLLFSIIISTVITLSISMPISRMVNIIKKVSDGDLDIRIHDEFEDEMGFLSQKFNAMIVQLKELKRQYQEDQKRKRELELNMLQAQINPHFLFNTLNSLKWTAQMSRVQTVSDGLGALADLLRNTIINKNELIPLQEELRNIENYLLIQKIRYGDSFNVLFEIGDVLKDKLILKFLLQPIVENSIIHGLQENKRQITITITCCRCGDHMKVLIRDDGKGFDMKGVDAWNTDGKKTGGEKLSKIGIDNVRERIILNFGEDYGLFVTSNIGSGTEVVMILPIIKD